MDAIVEYLNMTPDNVAEPSSAKPLSIGLSATREPLPGKVRSAPGTKLNPQYIDDDPRPPHNGEADPPRIAVGQPQQLAAPAQPVVFATYHVFTQTPAGWTATSTRTIFVREGAPRAAITLRGGRSIPPPLDFEDWNVWTVGNMEIKCKVGGLHLDYLREVLKRIDGNNRRKWTTEQLKDGVNGERVKQFRAGLMVDRPANWHTSRGWWVYVQPL